MTPATDPGILRFAIPKGRMYDGVASLLSAAGLGVPVVRALNQVNTALGFESGFVIVVLAIMLDRMLRVDRK